ncbi:host specificity J domain protein, partial [Escherichia coli DEC4F]
TFAITAVQHVPEKEAIVDNGARFEPQSGTLNSVIPPAVQHLTVEVSAADGQHLAQAKWGHAEGGEGRELYASPDRGRG